MSITLGIEVKRLTVIGGVRQMEEDSRFDASVHQESPRTVKGSLLVLVEANGPMASSLRQSIREAIFQSYYRNASLSVTSSLMRAIRHALSQVPSFVGVRGGPQVEIGIGCLVFKDRDVYLARAGPSLAFIARSGQAHLIGGLELLADETAVAIGEDADIHLFHSFVQPGDIVVLASGSLRQALNLKELGSDPRGQTATQMRQALYESWSNSNCSDDMSALIIRVDHARQQKPISVRQALDRMNRSRGQSAGRPTKASHDQARDSVPSSEYQDRPPDEDYLEGQGPLLGDRLVALLENAGPALWQFARQFPNQANPRLRNVLLALTVVLLVGSCLLTVAIAWQGRQLEASALSMIDDAEAKERLALDSSDKDVQYRLLTEAEALAIQAESIRKDDLNLRIVRERIQQELDSLGGVVRAHSASELVDLGAIGGSNEPSGIIAAHGSLYILDPPSQSLYRFRLKESGTAVEADPRPAIVHKGDSAAQSEVSGLVSMGLVPAGGLREKDAIVLIDDRGSLYEYEPNQGLTSLGLADGDLSGEAPVLGGYAGNLYLLDAQSNRLLWYPPTSTGFDRFAYNYLNPGVSADFTSAMAMAVDSSVYVLHDTGVISQFYGGKPAPFDMSVPGAPLKLPVALAIGQVSRSLYVLDRGHQRVVVFDPENGFLNQIRSGGTLDPFQKAHNLAVDEQAGRLYLLSGQKIYTISLN